MSLLNLPTHALVVVAASFYVAPVIFTLMADAATKIC